MPYKADADLEKLAVEHNRKQDVAMNAHDADGFNKLITDDYTFYAGLSEPCRGKPMTKKLAQEWFDAGAKNEKITKEEVLRLSADHAIIISHFTIDFPDEKGVLGPMAGKLLDLFVRETDGKWRTKIHFFAEDAEDKKK
jgi:ketosteroid isomerase-like protein